MLVLALEPPKMCHCLAALGQAVLGGGHCFSEDSEAVAHQLHSSPTIGSVRVLLIFAFDQPKRCHCLAALGQAVLGTRHRQPLSSVAMRPSRDILRSLSCSLSPPPDPGSPYRLAFISTQRVRAPFPVGTDQALSPGLPVNRCVAEWSPVSSAQAKVMSVASAVGTR